MAKKEDEVTPGVKVNFIAGEQLAAVELDGLWQSSLERLLDGCISNLAVVERPGFGFGALDIRA